MKTNEVKKLVLDSLTDMKARDIVVLDVAKTSTFTDLMIICSGGSNRQVKAIAGEVVQRTKAASIPPLGVEGDTAAEWVLVDLGDVVVHVMQQSTRDFYQLEKLWDPELSDS
jgi:ribosome-associated protein